MKPELRWTQTGNGPKERAERKAKSWKEHARSYRGGWRQNGRKSECVKQGDLTNELDGGEESEPP